MGILLISPLIDKGLRGPVGTKKYEILKEYIHSPPKTFILKVCNLLELLETIKLILWCSQAQTGGTDLGKEDHRGKVLFPSRYIEGTDYQHDIAIAVDLKHLPKVVLVRVLHYKITLWFFFLTSFSYFTL